MLVPFFVLQNFTQVPIILFGMTCLPGFIGDGLEAFRTLTTIMAGAILSTHYRQGIMVEVQKATQMSVARSLWEPDHPSEYSTLEADSVDPGFDDGLELYAMLKLEALAKSIPCGKLDMPWTIFLSQSYSTDRLPGLVDLYWATDSGALTENILPAPQLPTG